MLRRWQPNPPVSLNSSARKACGVRAQTPEALAVGCRGRSSLRSARGPRCCPKSECAGQTVSKGDNLAVAW